MARLFRIKNRVLRVLAGLFVLLVGIAAAFAACIPVGFVLRKLGLDWWSAIWGGSQQSLLGSGYMTACGLALLYFVILYYAKPIGDKLFNHVNDKKVEDKKKEETGG